MNSIVKKTATATAAMLLMGGAVAASAPASAAAIVTTVANPAVPGTSNVNAPFGAAGNATMYKLQVQYAASLFSDVAIGSQLTSIGFRLAPGSRTNSTALDYTDFSVQVGTGAHGMTALERTFANNIGPDTILARTGPLSFARNTLPVDICARCTPRVRVNSFFTIDLTTPYTYKGGDLLITLSSTLAAGTVGKIVALDAVDPYLVPTVSTLATSGIGSLPTRGVAVNFSYAPIMRFAFADPVVTAVPEPASWAMMIGGFGLVGGSLRRRRSARVAFGAR